MSEKRRFTFNLEGQYYGAHSTSGLPGIKQYKASFVLPTQEAALSIIVKHLLKPYLVRHYEDFANIRTHKIVGKKVEGRPPDGRVNQMLFEEMQIEDLNDFCILNDILVDPHKWKSLEDCREYVQKIFNSRTDERKLAKKMGKDVEAKMVNELLELNNLKPVDDFTPTLAEQRIGAALKNRGDGRINQKVGYERLDAPQPAEPTPPLADVPQSEEVPVDNDPRITNEAFEKGAEENKEIEDIFS